MDGAQYVLVCQVHKLCNPKDGMKLEHLREVYLSQDTDSLEFR